MTLKETDIILSDLLNNPEDYTQVRLFELSEKIPAMDLPSLREHSGRKVQKEEFLSKAEKLSYSFTHSEGQSPNKRILAVFVHPNGYATFGYPKEEGWKHYLFS